MAGFFDRFSTGPFAAVGSTLQRVSRLGIRYDDMLIKQSRAIGATEAALGGSDFTPRELAQAMSYADIQQKKYIPIFDKDYVPRRDFLRKFALNNEVDFMLSTITDECIVYDETNYFAYPSFSLLDLKEDIKDEINDEFKRIYNHFKFVDDITAWHFFRKFLVDGMLAFEIIYDRDGKKILGFKEIDAAYMKWEIVNEGGVLKKIWYQYPDNPSMTRKLYDAQVIFISYATGTLPSRVSYLENMVRSFNLLRIVENAMVMWSLMNSTWRVKMIVPIGSRSPQKAKESLGEMMALYKEDISIDAGTGELTVNGSPSIGQFYRNYLFPSKNGEQVDIQPMAGEGPDMANNPLVNYFTNKLHEDSKIPFARFDKSTNGGQLTGIAASGVDREEIRFYKFCNRLRSTFQEILIKPLWIQMCLNHPELEKDEIFKSSLGLRWTKDNLFEEIRNIEIMTKRLEFINALLAVQDGDKPYVPTEWAMENYMKWDKDTLDSIKKAKKEAEEKAKEAGEGGEGGEGEGGGEEGTSLGF